MEALMAEKVSRTLQVLIEMRDEMRKTNERIDHLETTMAEQFTGVAAVLRDMHVLLRDRLDQRDRVDDHERRITQLERASG
jgi:hypothetical protein